MKPTVIALINNKGGTAKTKSTEHLGYCIALAGYIVTLIDSDGQANLSDGLGIAPGGLTLSDVLSATHTHLAATTYRAHWPFGLGLIPADNRLDETADDMALHPLRISRLATILADPSTSVEIVLIDTPPNVGPLVYAASIAADYVIIPAVPVRESIAGIKRTFRLLAEVKAEMGRAPTVLGIIATHVQETTLQHQLGLESLEAFDVPLLGCVPHRIGQNAEAQLRAAYQPIAHHILTAIGKAPTQ